jgi:hypothetical protein
MAWLKMGRMGSVERMIMAGVFDKGKRSVGAFYCQRSVL